MRTRFARAYVADTVTEPPDRPVIVPTGPGLKIAEFCDDNVRFKTGNTSPLRNLADVVQKSVCPTNIVAGHEISSATTSESVTTVTTAIPNCP